MTSSIVTILKESLEQRHESKNESIINPDGVVEVENNERPDSSASSTRRKCVKFIQRPAVIFESAYKRKGGRGVLVNFNMTVKEHTIYCLIGSKRSGKSTVLSLLSGVESLDSGKVLVCGIPPGLNECGIPGRRIGYMPPPSAQNHALFPLLTVDETLGFYGRVQGMSYEDIQRRRGDLYSLLQMAEISHKKIENLDESEKRIVSFTVALIHHPEILILDEPTLGVEPVLREKIWQILTELVTEKTTVLMTCQYAEEARRADIIGVLSHGRLLIEEYPVDFITNSKKSSLEDSLLELNVKDGAERKSQSRWNNIDVSIRRKKEKEREEEYETPEEKILSMKNIQQHLLSQVSWNVGKRFLNQTKFRLEALSYKTALLANRQIWSIFFLLLLPLLFVFLLSTLLISEPTNLKFGLINHEVPFEERNWCPSLHSEQDICKISNKVKLGCYFTDFLKNSTLINLIELESVKDGHNAMENEGFWGFLSLSHNFTNELELKNSSLITYTIDVTHGAISDKINRWITQSFENFLIDIAKNCRLPDLSSNERLMFEFQPYPHSFNQTLPSSPNSSLIVPNVALQSLFLLASLTSSLIFIGLKKDGVVKRLKFSGVKHIELLLTHMVAQSLLLLPQTILVFCLVFYYFKIVAHGSTLLAFIIIYMTGITGLSLGFFIGSCISARRRVDAVVLTLFLSLPSLFITGVISPFEGLPVPFQYMSYIYPTTLPGLALNDIVLRGQGLKNLVPWLGLFSGVGWAAAFLSISILLHFQYFISVIKRLLPIS